MHQVGCHFVKFRTRSSSNRMASWAGISYQAGKPSNSCRVISDETPKA